MCKKVFLFVALFWVTLNFLTVNAQPVSWQSRGIGGGGALFSPSVNPLNTNEMYISCDMTEIFHTTNAGLNWETLPFYNLRGSVTSKVAFTSNNAIRYAINFDFYTETYFPVKSNNSGNTWFPISDPTAGECYAIFADGNSTKRIIIASYNKIYFSNNGGVSFTNIYTNLGSGAAHIGGVFFDGTNIYIGAAKNLIVSADNGASFTSYTLNGLPAGRGIVSFTGARVGAVTRLFITGFDLVDIYPGITGADFSYYKSIYKMDYSPGGTWIAANTGITGSNKAFFIDMAQNNIDIAYCAGGNTSTGYPIVYKTINGGANWNAVLLTNNNENIYTGYQGDNGDEGWYFDEFAEGFDVAASDANVAVLTGLGFPHYTDNGGAVWHQQYVNVADQNPLNMDIVKGKNYAGVGLENTSCWTLCWSDINSVFAGFSDITAIKSGDGGIKWNKNYTTLTENSVYKVIHENVTGKLYAATSSAHDMYQSTYLKDDNINGATGRILFSSDNGTTWNVLHDFADAVIDLAFDPNVANKMYACVINSLTGGIYVSSNINLGAASTWTKLANPPRTEGHPYNIQVLNDGTLIAAYSGRRTAAGTFTASSGVFKSTDNGITWIDISDPGMYYWTKDVLIDPNDITQNTIYCAVFSGWGGAPNGLGGIYKTVNRGASWTKINALDRVESVAIDPNNANSLYATSESDGLWITNNLNDAVPVFSQVSNYPFQHPVRVIFNPFNTNEIWVTSFGNGLYNAELDNCTAPVNLVVSAVTATTATLSWDIVPSADSYRITLKVGGATYNFNSATNSYHFTDLMAGSSNKITVKANCDGSYSDKSVKVTINTPLRFANDDNKIKFYPNPAQDFLLMENCLGLYAIEIYSLEGKLIKTSQFEPEDGTLQFSISDLQNGMYIIKTHDAHGVQMSKFLKG